MLGRILAPIAVSMHMGRVGRVYAAHISALVTSCVLVIVINVRCPVRNAAELVGAVLVSTLVPMLGRITAPIAVGMHMRRVGRIYAAHISALVTSCILVIVVNVRCPVRNAAEPVGAVLVGTLMPMLGRILAPIAVGMHMGRVGRVYAAHISALVTSCVFVIVVNVRRPVRNAAELVGTVLVGTLVPMLGRIAVPIAVGVIMNRHRVLPRRVQNYRAVIAVNSAKLIFGSSALDGRPTELRISLARENSVFKREFYVENLYVGLRVRFNSIAVGFICHGKAKFAVRPLRSQPVHVRSDFISGRIKNAVAAEPHKIAVVISVGTIQAL